MERRTRLTVTAKPRLSFREERADGDPRSCLGDVFPAGGAATLSLAVEYPAETLESPRGPPLGPRPLGPSFPPGDPTHPPEGLALPSSEGVFPEHGCHASADCPGVWGAQSGTSECHVGHRALRGSGQEADGFE